MVDELVGECWIKTETLNEENQNFVYLNIFKFNPNFIVVKL